MTNDNLRNRIESFIEAANVNVVKLCRSLNISESCFYRWRHGERNLTENRLKTFDDYLTKFNY